MKSPFQFIVKPVNGKRYDNTKKIAGIDFITSTSQEDHKFSNRYAQVVSTPVNYSGPIQINDTLLVQFFMYKHKDQWHAHDRYCFVKPVSTEDSYIFKPFSEEPLVGVMKYPNNYLKLKGVKKGDKISFQPESEYEFIVDGEKLYRMFDHQIALLL